MIVMESYYVVLLYLIPQSSRMPFRHNGNTDHQVVVIKKFDVLRIPFATRLHQPISS